jgi:signal transduction histidine kinase
MATNLPEPECHCPAENPHADSGTQPPHVRVLLIDDDDDDFVLTKELIADIPGGRFTLDWASTSEAGLKALCGGTHDVYLLDYRLGAKTGIDLLREAHGHGCSGPVILLTGQGELRTDLEALDAGADDYLEKTGLTPLLLKRAMRYALAQHSAEVELERKVQQRTEELAKVNDALREANQRKDEFLSTLGHELRNPLAPIANSLELMRLSPDRPDVIERQRERLERQFAQMTRLVNELLDVSRVATGKLVLSLEPVPLQDVLDAALDVSLPHIEKANLTLTQDLPSEPLWLNADSGRLSQVFSNLLNNSAKYTPRGGTVAVTAQAHEGRVVVQVRDTGAGIPVEMLPRVFDLFTQVDRTLNRAQGGLGVGLAIVKRLVEIHNGAVSCHSDGPGTGTEFTVELPLASNPSWGRS